MQDPVALPSRFSAPICRGITLTKLVCTHHFTYSKAINDTKNIHLEQRKKKSWITNREVKGEVISILHNTSYGLSSKNVTKRVYSKDKGAQWETRHD